MVHLYTYIRDNSLPASFVSVRPEVTNFVFKLIRLTPTSRFGWENTHAMRSLWQGQSRCYHRLPLLRQPYLRLTI